MILLLIVLAYMIGIRIGTYGIFKKLGVEPWKAFVPILCSFEWQKIIDRPRWWTWMLFIPGVNLFYIASQLSEMSTAFKRYGFWEHFAAVMLAFAYFPYLGFSKKEQFIGPGGVKPGKPALKRGTIREWADAIVFAVVAATLIRIFVAEAYMIPTESMEKTLLVGDFLFVSKFHYGARIPNTPLAMPFVHHTIPVLNCKSYVEWIKLPYKKLPGFQDVKRNDMVVFNFPAGDTLTEEYQSEQPYYDIIRSVMNSNRLDYATARQQVWDNFHIITRPVDKRENYIKRCVAVPGDNLQVKDGVLYINSKPAFQPENMNTEYIASFKPNSYISDDLKEEYMIEDEVLGDGIHHRLFLTTTAYKKLVELGLTTQLSPRIDSAGIPAQGDYIYPNNLKYSHWNADNFGPVHIPAKGETVTLNDSTFTLYQRAIHVYENNTVDKRDGKFYINGAEATSYTFKMNYYWMMGDNRHKSQDSRYWGFVPEDHIVGKAWFIWMSWNKNGSSFFKKVRWNRLFTSIHGKWAPNDEQYTK